MKNFKLAVIIPTYNNSETILDTLNSLLSLKETGRVELIISDDASTDSTVNLIRQWMETNGEQFWKHKLIPNKINAGITANHIKAFDAAENEYGLYLGGDDLVYNRDLVNGIEEALSRKPAAKIAKVNVEALYLPDGHVEDLYRRLGLFFRMNAKQQFTALSLFGNFLYAGPGTIVHIPTLRKIKALDTSIKTFEDYPLFLNFLLNRYKIHLFKMRGVYWVRSRHSLSAKGFGTLKPQFDSELSLIQNKYVSANVHFMVLPGKMVWSLRRFPFIFRIIKRISTAVLGFPN
ncbi:MAG: glycosyltransferase [Spirochaetales bacterium]|nr:glycosyltransferase [Spirochaetales bacterium]